jgi:hypothetical protein
MGWAWLVGLLVVGCGSERDICDGNCPDVSGTFSLVSVEPLGDCSFATYLPPPMLTITQSGDGRHVTTQLIDPVNQLLVSVQGNVLEPKDSDGDAGHFVVHTRGLRQATQDTQQALTLELMITGTVTRSADGASLSSTLTELQQEPAEGSGCEITLPLNGRSTDASASAP